jgi:hypothetical protein
MAYSEKVFLIMVEDEDGNFSARVYKDDSILSSFENLTRTADGKKCRATVIELQYGEDVISVISKAKLLSQPFKKGREEGTKLGSNKDLQDKQNI